MLEAINKMEDLSINKRMAQTGMMFMFGWALTGTLIYLMPESFPAEAAKLVTLIANIMLGIGGLCFAIVAVQFLFNGVREISKSGAVNPDDALAAGNLAREQSDEEVELRRKLNLIDRKEKDINKLLSKGLKPDKKKILDDALEFLDDQKLVVKTRLLVFEYLAWENYALLMCQKMMAPGYFTESNTVFSTRVIKEITAKGDSLTNSFLKVRETSVFETVRQILPRLTQILKTCRELLDEIENNEIAGVLKDVRQLEANTIPLLPESTAVEAVKILQEFQQRPLNQDLLFEHLRIKSLKELNNIQ